MSFLASDWNSLEVAKLLVSSLTPILVIAIGLGINRSLKRLEQIQWKNQKVIEKRLSVFEELAPYLNDLLCYFTFVGCWKDLTPVEVVKLKRRIDRTVHVNAPLFSTEFLDRYYDFINLCYGTYSGWGQDAKLRTLADRRRESAGTTWNEKWTDCFAEVNDCSDPRIVKSSYIALMTCFSKELGVGLDQSHIPSGGIPENLQSQARSQQIGLRQT